MDTGSDLPLLIGLVVLFATAVFMGAAEAALLRVPRSRVAVAADRGDHAAARVLRLIENLPQAMNTILLVVLLAQIGAATLVGVYAGRHFGSLGVTLASVLLTLVLFVYAEAVPKTLAVRHPMRVSKLVVSVVSWLVKLFWPVTRSLVAFADLQAPGRGIAGHMGVSEDELRFLADEAANWGEIDQSDHELIERGFELGDLTVGEIIVPRLDVVAVAVETPVTEALDIAVAAGHRRLPVHEGDLDSVVGVVGLRDLAAAVSDGSAAVAGDLARSVPIVPETKRVMELLREMQARGRHLAVVIDEHGGTSGIVTIEDVVEELVGQVADEGEVRRPSFKRLAPGKWEVDTRTDVADIADLIGRDLPQGDWHTVAGLVIHLAGRIPVAGDVVEIEDHTILVTEATARRVQRVVIERTIPPGPTTTAGETA